MEIDKEEIITVIEQLKELAPESPEDYQIKGELYERAVSGQDLDLVSDLYYNLGIVRFQQQDWEQAITSFNRSIEYSPKNKRDALINLGASKSESGDQTWALKDYRLAEGMPEANDADLLNNIGVSYARLAETGNPEVSLTTAMDYFNRSLLLRQGWEVAQENQRTCSDELDMHRARLAEQSDLKELEATPPDLYEEIRTDLQNIRKEIKDLRPATTSQIKGFVDERLGVVATESLPRKVRDFLYRGERQFRDGADTDASKLGFCKAVEGTLWHMLGQGFTAFIRESQEKRINIIEYTWEKEKKEVSLPAGHFGSKASLTNWSDLFSALSSTSPFQTDAQNTMLGQYLASTFNENLNLHLDNLTADLRKIQGFRNGAAHFPKNIEFEDPEDLVNLRDIVLGTKGRQSLLKNVVEWFKPKEQP
jgi:tetratricopeptide (TPR) repeat protein